MIKQYKELKEKHHDAVFLFRVGDFYKTYEEDAVTAARILGITFHYGPQQRSGDIKGAWAEFPHHALDTYLPKLVRAGKRVAICEELS